MSLSRICEKIIRHIGAVCAWSLALLVVTILANVAARYAFNRPVTVFAELQWHLYGLAGMLGMAYTLAEDGHVRVDLFHMKFPDAVKRWLEAGILLFLVMPFSAYLAWTGWDFAAGAFRIGERSALPGGLPARWIVKGLIPLGAAILFVEALAKLVLVVTGKWPVEKSDEVTSLD